MELVPQQLARRAQHRIAEEAQFHELCTMERLAGLLSEFPNTRIDDEKLHSLRVVRSSPLDVDNPASLDTGDCFFLPSYDDEHLVQALGDPEEEPERFPRGLVETGQKLQRLWGETRDGDRDDPDWCPGDNEGYPRFRAEWPLFCFQRMQQTHLERWSRTVDEEEQRELDARTDGWRYASLHPEEVRMPRPAKEQVSESDYRPIAFFQPRDPNKPHLAVVMGDSEVAREDEGGMLTSELDAVVKLAKRQLRFPHFTDHHTKPVIVYTFMWETHARITQAHVDPASNRLVVRQSRVLDLRGAAPTPDAYLLVRWMMNRPVGDTEYGPVVDDPAHAPDAAEPLGGCRRAAVLPSLVMVGAS